MAKIDFVKMDVEGHEPLVLKGFLSLIRKHKPTLLTEFNPICLKEFLHIQPIEYLEQLFTCYSSLQVLSAFGDLAIFTDANSLMQYWSKRNAEIAGQNLLPDGMLHFDVIAANR